MENLGTAPVLMLIIVSDGVTGNDCQDGGWQYSWLHPRCQSPNWQDKMAAITTETAAGRSADKDHRVKEPKHLPRDPDGKKWATERT